MDNVCVPSFAYLVSSLGFRQFFAIIIVIMLLLEFISDIVGHMFGTKGIAKKLDKIIDLLSNQQY